MPTNKRPVHRHRRRLKKLLEYLLRSRVQLFSVRHLFRSELKDIYRNWLRNSRRTSIGGEGSKKRLAGRNSRDLQQTYLFIPECVLHCVNVRTSGGRESGKAGCPVIASPYALVKAIKFKRYSLSLRRPAVSSQARSSGTGRTPACHGFLTSETNAIGLGKSFQNAYDWFLRDGHNLPTASGARKRTMLLDLSVRHP